MSACDCRLTAFYGLTDAKRCWIKGRQFSLAGLLADTSPGQQLASQFDDGCMMIFRLAPQVRAGVSDGQACRPNVWLHDAFQFCTVSLLCCCSDEFASCFGTACMMTLRFEFSRCSLDVLTAFHLKKVFSPYSQVPLQSDCSAWLPIALSPQGCLYVEDAITD